LAETISLDTAAVHEKVINFIKDRFKNILLSEGISQDILESVLTVDFSYLNLVEEKIEAIKKFRESFSGFETLVTAFKRISNITKGFRGTGEVNPELFEHESEKKLWSTFLEVSYTVQQKIEEAQYLEALNLLAGLRGPVDTFFSEVMVMAEDRAVRENRLTLLAQLKECFLQMADFSVFAMQY
jgi:glycyl-tRNA synthetase beta chain